MKLLIRKIFFWDEPATGAFFGLTLLITVPWFLFSLWCGILVFDYTLFRTTFPLTMFDTTYPLILFMTILFIVALYIAVIFLKMLCFSIRMSPHFWRRLIVLIIAIGAVTVIYAVTVSFEKEMYWHWVPAIVAILGIAYLFHPIAKPWKVLACNIAWMSSCFVFLAIFVYAYEPFRCGTLHELSHQLWLYDEFPGIHVLHDRFDLGGNGCFWFAALGTTLLAAAYLLSGNILANIGKHSTRQLFRRSICLQWGIFAGIYVIALIFAIAETSNYHRAIQKLETHFGHPMTAAELGRQFYDGRRPNPVFWQEMEKLFEEYHKTQGANEWMFQSHPFGVLPDEVYAKRKKVFMASNERILLETMVEAILQPPERKYAEDLMLASMLLPELSMFREMSRMESRHIRYAIDSGDFETAAKAIARIDNICNFLSKDHFNISYLVWMAIGNIRLEASEKILETGIPSEKWLEEQLVILTEMEAQARQMEKQVLYGEAVSYLNILHWLANYAGNDLGRPSLNFNSLRFFFPQGWWLAANNVKGLAQTFLVSEFSQMPDTQTGYLFVDMFVCCLPSLTNKILAFTASCRILRGLIAAAVQKKRSGDYPEMVGNLLIDPFSEQPLKYRKRPCQINVYVYKKARKDEEMFGTEGMDDEHTADSYEVVAEERTVEAIQIWSVGPDGIDDGGIKNKPEYGSEEKAKDDIRFIIRLE